jgi:hypothetical protein
MIHAPAIHVTCDAQWCESRLAFPVDLTPETIAHRLLAEYGWLIRDGQHFCCHVCADDDHWEARLQQPHCWPLTACSPPPLETMPATAVSWVVTAVGVPV